MNRPKLLFLSHTLPYPPDGGVKIRTFHVLRLLAEQFDIDALCFYRRAAHAGEEKLADSLDALRQHADVEAFPIPQEHSRLRFLWDHGRSVATGRPYTRYTYESRRFDSRLEELRRGGDYNLVHVDSLDLSRYMPRLPMDRVVCGHHNVESQLLRRRGRTVEGALEGAYLKHQARLLQREEDRWCPRVRLNVTVSERDRRTLRDRLPEAETVVVPNGVDTSRYSPSDTEETEGVVFVGGCTWFPNRDALVYFTDEILPRLRRRRGAVDVKWVGRAEPELRERYGGDGGVEMTGYVEDIRPFVRRASCYVVPIRVGGGSRLKILDAWAMGKAVVSTRQGCEGLDARDGENILVRDEPEAFARAVDRVLEDAALRRRLGRRARRTAEETYSWEVVGAEMNQVYAELLSEEQQSPSTRVHG